MSGSLTTIQHQGGWPTITRHWKAFLRGSIHWSVSPLLGALWCKKAHYQQVTKQMTNFVVNECFSWTTERERSISESEFYVPVIALNVPWATAMRKLSERHQTSSSSTIFQSCFILQRLYRRALRKHQEEQPEISHSYQRMQRNTSENLCQIWWVSANLRTQPYEALARCARKGEEHWGTDKHKELESFRLGWVKTKFLRLLSKNWQTLAKNEDSIGFHCCSI